MGGCTQAQIKALGTFGRDLGIELQLLDDVLDLVSDPETMGKPTNADFRAGLLTMPTVFAAGSCRERDRKRLRQLFTEPIGDAEASAARELVTNSGGVSRTIELARLHAGRAARFAASAGAVGLTNLPDRYLSGQLRKATADFRILTRGPSSRDRSDASQRSTRTLGDRAWVELLKSD